MSKVGPFCAVCLLVLASMAASPKATPAEMRCQSIAFEGDIVAGQVFERDIGAGLTLALVPQNFGDATTALSGWRIQILGDFGKKPPAGRDDYIYLANLPLRFNPSQDIGTSYGVTAEEKLRHSISYAFVLNKTDYEKMAYMLDDALWPYAAHDPQNVDERYLSTLAALALGELRFVPLHVVTDHGGQGVQRLRFRVTIATPNSFQFSRAFSDHPSACPSQRQ